MGLYRPENGIIKKLKNIITEFGNEIFFSAPIFLQAILPVLQDMNSPVFPVRDRISCVTASMFLCKPFYPVCQLIVYYEYVIIMTNSWRTLFQRIKK